MSIRTLVLVVLACGAAALAYKVPELAAAISASVAVLIGLHAIVRE